MFVSDCDPCESQATVFSRQKLVARCMGRLALVERLVRILADGLPRDTLEIEAAIESDEMERVASLAHRMKGAAANICAERVAAAAANLEQAARVCDRLRVSEAWNGLRQEVGVLLEALKRKE
jgi:HPt (histidine-containing phosphotransfer) domain-containing protein